MVGKLRANQSAAGRAEGACAKCCDKFCRCSPFSTAVCWASVALLVIVLILWIGGSFLTGPARDYISTSAKTTACVNKEVPIGFGRDPYAWYTTSSGIIVTLTIFATCLYCISYLGLCCGSFPRVVRIVGLIGMIVTFLAFTVFLFWIGLGTYLAAEISTKDLPNATNGTTQAPDFPTESGISIRVCINFAIYLLMFYVYLFVFVVFALITVLWKCNSAASGAKSRSKA